MSEKCKPMTQQEKESAARLIRDYYNPSPSEVMLKKHVAAFERARAEYVRVLTRQLFVAEQVSFGDLFPARRQTTTDTFDYRAAERSISQDLSDEYDAMVPQDSDFD